MKVSSYIKASSYIKVSSYILDLYAFFEVLSSRSSGVARHASYFFPVGFFILLIILYSGVLLSYLSFKFKESMKIQNIKPL